MLLASEKLDLHSKLDNDMFNHIIYVSNRILMITKKEGLSKDSIESMAKYLWRLFRVFQAYNHKNRDATLREILDVVSQFRSVFGG